MTRLGEKVEGGIADGLAPAVRAGQAVKEGLQQAAEMAADPVRSRIDELRRRLSGRGGE